MLRNTSAMHESNYEGVQDVTWLWLRFFLAGVVWSKDAVRLK